MTGLEQTFDIMAIIFMSLMFLLLVGILVAVLVIKKKITKIHDEVESKLHTVTSIAERSGELTAIATNQVIRQAKRAIHKAKK